ncbi:MAG: N-carbamoylputrescine amidase [Myxococcales bacterium]|nr:N-carbamoylputrescine amidase [Myxococcales bacterium]MCB9707446.1 N-carbamoylputrescine amidase [Myxococcales bacterium]
MHTAITQFSVSPDREANIEKATGFVREAAQSGAEIILLPELFSGPYFPRTEDAAFFSWAEAATQSPTLQHFSRLARELGVVLPISFFEKDGQLYYNSVAVLDADGTCLGVYRKSHIPDGPGYEEKFYFRPGKTGFKVWDTRFGAIGVGICWDQWFPECARIMTLLGADILLYPTAIGSEPTEPALDTSEPWRRAMLGHAVSNLIPIAAANRVGIEHDQTFYGRSFICDALGEIVAELDRTHEGIGYASFDAEEVRKTRASFGFFRDRRPDLYLEITKDH